ncbi:GNAT family N-acetyltransferase [Candidatus Uhrbacteria bacterium]|nr:GNAT family N-acetyltransferase [Candidatus Uhrbacteria bacterium]
MKVRDFTMEDAPFVNSMLKEEYGWAYPYLLTFEPPQEDILLVAEKSEEIAAFAKATYVSRDIFELGSLIIHPTYRGNGLAERMVRERLSRIISQNSDALVITEPVCYRVDRASQRNCLDHGKFKQFGIQPAKHPLIHPDLLGSQPESLTFAVRDQGDLFFQGRRLNLPARWQGVASTLCKEMFSGRLLSGKIPKMTYHPPNTVNDICGSEFLDIPANWEESALLMERYHARGYCFSAILPRMGRRGDEVYDLVRLYRPQGDIDWKLIHVTDDLAPLKEFMEEEEGGSLILCEK